MLAYPPPDNESFGNNTKAAKAAAAALAGVTVAGAPVHVTGFDALQNQTGGGNGPGVLLESVLGGLGALVVLGFVFASLLAFVPLLMAIVSIMTTFLVLWGVTAVTDVSMIVEFLVALIGLGVAIDYSLLVVVRWREERAHGREGDEAVVRAMETAGRAVVFSGTTVAIGLLAMIVLPLPFLRSIGYAGMLIPLVSVIVAITLLPVVLAKVGRRLDWPHIRSDDQASRSWTRGRARRSPALGRGARRPGRPRGAGDRGHRPAARSGERQHARQAGRRARRTCRPRALGDRRGRARADRGARPAQRPRTRRGQPPRAVRSSTARSPRPALPGASAGPRSSTPSSSRTGRATAGSTRSQRSYAGPRVGAGVRVGGVGAENADFVDAIYGSFPVMIALIAVLTFLLLARAFRSLLLPVKAVLLNVISVGAAWGVITLVWQQGHGSSRCSGSPPPTRSPPGSR